MTNLALAFGHPVDRVLIELDPKAVCRDLRRSYKTFGISGWRALGLEQVPYEGLSIEPDMEFILVFVRMLERAVKDSAVEESVVFLAQGLLALSARVHGDRVQFATGYPGAELRADLELQRFVAEWRGLASQVHSAWSR